MSTVANWLDTYVGVCAAILLLVFGAVRVSPGATWFHHWAWGNPKGAQRRAVLGAVLYLVVVTLMLIMIYAPRSGVGPMRNPFWW